MDIIDNMACMDAYVEVLDWWKHSTVAWNCLVKLNFIPYDFNY
jgi:hypothetical protein